MSTAHGASVSQYVLEDILTGPYFIREKERNEINLADMQMQMRQRENWLINMAGSVGRKYIYIYITSWTVDESFFPQLAETIK